MKKVVWTLAEIDRLHSIGEKGLGKKQRELLETMRLNGYVARAVHDYSRQEHRVWLEDEDGANSYDKLKSDTVQSLYNRGLLSMEEFSPSLGIDIITFRAKSSNHFQENPKP